MTTLAEVRQKYPQYADLDDATLGKALHTKYYADMPYEDFAQRVGLGSAAPASSGPPRRYVDPNRGKTGGELAMGGVRKFAGDTMLGVAQAANAIPAMLGHKGAQERQHTMEGMADVRKLDPVMRTGAGQAGYTGGALGAAVPAMFVPGANTVAGSAAIGSILGMMQPTGTGDSRTENAAVGAAAGAAGQGLFNAAAKVAQPVKSALTAAEKRAVELLRGKGVSLSVGQQTGSRAAQAVERTLADNPAAAGQMARQGDKFRTSFTRATLKTIGENGDGATPEVLGRAATRIGGVFDDVASKYDLDVTSTNVANALNRIDKQAKEELLNDPRIATQIQAIRDAAQQHGGKLKGETYKNIKTTLDNLSKQQNIGPIAFELRQVLDDALHVATQGTDDFARLMQARAQYRNLQALADVADTTANGQVSAAALAQRLKSNKYTRNSMRFGKGDAELAKLARAGSTVVDRFPNSGTAARAAAQLGIPAITGGAGYLATGDLETAGKLAAAAWAVPRGAGYLMTNPGVQNYLSRGVASGPVRNALTFPSQRALGTALPAYLLSQD